MWVIGKEIWICLALVIAFKVCGVKGDCGEIPPVDHVHHNLTGVDPPYPTGTVASFSCQRGYTQSGLPYKYCADNGTWIVPTNYPPFRCTPISCNSPGNIRNGVKDSYVYTVGKTVKYTCDEGFEMIGRSTLLCMASGSWSDPTPTCQAIECPVLENPAEGYLIGSDRGYGQTIRFECNEGYTPAGPDTATCQLDKTWTNQPFVCQEIDCGPAPKVPNAVVTQLGGTTWGEAARVRCFENATSSSDLAFNTIFCSDTGHWTSPPECMACCSVAPVLNDNSVAFIQGEGCVPHGETRDVSLYSCEEGFYVHSPVSSVRCRRGAMSTNLTCLPITCEVPKIEFGRVLKRQVGQVVEYGVKMTVECDRGYNLTSASSVVCDRSVSFPSCRQESCSVESLPYDQISVEPTCLTLSDAYVRHSCVVDVTCGDSLRVVKGACHFGDWQVEECPDPKPPVPGWAIALGVIGGLIAAGFLLLLGVKLAKNSKRFERRSGAANHNSEVIGLQKKEPPVSGVEGEPA